MEHGGEIWARGRQGPHPGRHHGDHRRRREAELRAGTFAGFTGGLALSPSMELGDGRYVLTVQLYRDGTRPWAGPTRRRCWSAPRCRLRATGWTTPGGTTPGGTTPAGRLPAATPGRSRRHHPGRDDSRRHHARRRPRPATTAPGARPRLGWPRPGRARDARHAGHARHPAGRRPRATPAPPGRQHGPGRPRHAVDPRLTDPRDRAAPGSADRFRRRLDARPGHRWRRHHDARRSPTGHHRVRRGGRLQDHVAEPEPGEHRRGQPGDDHRPGAAGDAHHPDRDHDHGHRRQLDGDEGRLPGPRTDGGRLRRVGLRGRRHGLRAQPGAHLLGRRPPASAPEDSGRRTAPARRRRRGGGSTPAPGGRQHRRRPVAPGRPPPHRSSGPARPGSGSCGRRSSAALHPIWALDCSSSCTGVAI